MAEPRIKFCGMTRPDDARAAAELGADFIGMVLHAESRRRIDLTVANQIIEAVARSVTPVGLFVDATVDQIRSTAQRLGLRYVQLHGKEAPHAVAALKGLSVFKAVRVNRSTLSSDLDVWKGVENLAALLLDTGSEAQPGGTGIENDWEAIRQLQASGGFDTLPPVVLAGGLRPDNVGAVVKLLNPWAVDVSSGIEESMGVKSLAKMTAFVRAARGH